MRKLLGLLVCTVVLGCAGGAAAAPYLWTDFVDGNHLQFSATGVGSHMFTHDITDSASGAFRPGPDTVSNYALALEFCSNGVRSTVQIGVGDLDRTITFRTFRIVVLGGTVEGRMQLNQSGLLTVTITRSTGTFTFEGSQLLAWGNRADTAPVPEPSTLLLLGSGLSGLGLWHARQWRARKKR